MSIAAQEVAAFTVYDENGVLVAGWRLKNASHGFSSLVLQIERLDSPLRADDWGVYLEIDAKGGYGRVKSLSYDRRAGLVQIILSDATSVRSEVALPVPSAATGSDREMLDRLVSAANEALC